MWPSPGTRAAARWRATARGGARRARAGWRDRHRGAARGGAALAAARASRRPARLGVVEGVARGSAQGGVGGRSRASSSASGVVTAHAAGIALRTISGLKLKNVAMTTSAGTGPSARRATRSSRRSRAPRAPRRPPSPRARSRSGRGTARGSATSSAPSQVPSVLLVSPMVGSRPRPGTVLRRRHLVGGPCRAVAWDCHPERIVARSTRSDLRSPVLVGGARVLAPSMQENPPEMPPTFAALGVPTRCVRASRSSGSASRSRCSRPPSPMLSPVATSAARPPPAPARPSPSAFRCWPGRKATPRRPKGLVLVPTRELAAQVQDQLAPCAGVPGRACSPSTAVPAWTAR